MKTILAFIDLSGADRAVARVAGRLARAFDGVVRLVHIIDSGSDYDGEELRKDASRGGLAHEMRRKRRALQLVAIGLKKEGTRATGLVIRGSPGKKALQELKRRLPDCVVVGKRRHGWLHRVLQGSIGAAVAQNAKCPVMIVPVDAAAHTSSAPRQP